MGSGCELWNRHGSLGCWRAIVDGRGGALLLAGLEGGDLGLLLADHVEEPVLGCCQWELNHMNLPCGGPSKRLGQGAAVRTTWPSCSYSSSWCSSPRLGALSWCGLCGQGPEREREDGLICISPGAGRAGSLRLRFIRMLDRRRARSTSRRMEPLEVRRESSC